ncbi:MAG: hypothetical protein LBV63_02655 [Candidatus Methanoplasma sp.]|nr:hypothetical protein [Candidatus Methanoplasma sp.]
MAKNTQITIEAWKAMITPVMRTVHKDLMNRHQIALGECGLTKMHVGYIMALKSGGMTLKALSEKLNMDKANTTRAMVFLRESDLIADDRKSENSRKYNIFLTEKGQTIADKLKKIMDEAFAEYTRGISEEEISAIVAVLEKIRKNIDPEGKLLLLTPPMSDDQCPDC